MFCGKFKHSLHKLHRILSTFSPMENSAISQNYHGKQLPVLAVADSLELIGGVPKLREAREVTHVASHQPALNIRAVRGHVLSIARIVAVRVDCLIAWDAHGVDIGLWVAGGELDRADEAAPGKDGDLHVGVLEAQSSAAVQGRSDRAGGGGGGGARLSDGAAMEVGVEAQ